MDPLLFNTNYIAPIWSGDRINKVRGLGGPELYGEGFDLTAHRGMAATRRRRPGTSLGQTRVRPSLPAPSPMTSMRCEPQPPTTPSATNTGGACP